MHARASIPNADFTATVTATHFGYAFWLRILVTLLRRLNDAMRRRFHCGFIGKEAPWLL